ncbi:hypothetical protein [Endozoicomonas sp. ALD040]|uniref:hypothetical protein n=1 Tax=unclassified Endozoicomonas TaxID=2644528 RepID=UPI003BAF738B
MNNSQTLLALKLELEVLQLTPARTPEQTRDKRERVLFIGALIGLIEKAELEDSREGSL